MKTQTRLVSASLLCAAAGMAIAGVMKVGHRSSVAYAQALPVHQAPVATDGGVVVQLCDGVTRTEVKGLKPGQQMSHAQAVDVTGKLMAEWRHKHPDAHWQMAQADTNPPAPSQPAAQSTYAAGGPGGVAGTSAPPEGQQGDTYASFHQRDMMVWKAQTDAFIEYGNKVFHSTKLLGSTIGVSCDMCHPNAANTHPETYPKYQEQLQRVALLRDMIEWCIENPVKGSTLGANDPKLRAIEAYILAQRKGVALDYGKH